MRGRSLSLIRGLSSRCSFSFLIRAIGLLGSEEGVFDLARERMVKLQLEGRGISDLRVLNAMREVKRHNFVPSQVKRFAYTDRPLSIGHQQTISQPYIVAYMTEILALKPDERVLEIGTGSGYQAAVLSLLVKEVYSIEIVPELANESAERLGKLGYSNVHVKRGDGYQGWPEEAPFDAIIVTAAPPEVPQALVDQLKTPGGRMILPVGTHYQKLMRIHKTTSGVAEKRLIPVRFVPMIHKNKK